MLTAIGYPPDPVAAGAGTPESLPLGPALAVGTVPAECCAHTSPRAPPSGRLARRVRAAARLCPPYEPTPVERGPGGSRRWGRHQATQRRCCTPGATGHPAVTQRSANPPCCG